MKSGDPASSTTTRSSGASAQNACDAAEEPAGSEAVSMTEVHRWAHAPARVPDAEGSTYYTPVVALFHEVCAGLRKAEAASGGLTAIGIDSWGVDYGLIGDGGRLARVGGDGDVDDALAVGDGGLGHLREGHDLA